MHPSTLAEAAWIPCNPCSEQSENWNVIETVINAAQFYLVSLVHILSSA